ncbi:hypothetical protein [Escherichia coli]|uniref:hypothetical protein n=1 Tax=Escherichia coli TaxID=562 RepID=UPI00208DDC87|nr:hypothetical protein [Escherichia coli]
MFPGQCGNTAFFFKSQPDQFHFEFRGIVFPGKSFFSAHEVSTCKISGCLSYRILDSGPDGTQTTLTDAEIQELKQRLSELQERQKPHLDTMKSLMGEYFHADYCGVMVTRYKAAGRVDYKKLLADKASGVKPEDVDQYREKSSERCRVTVTGSVKPRYIVDEDVLAPLDDLPEEVETFYW